MGGISWSGKLAPSSDDILKKNYAGEGESDSYRKEPLKDILNYTVRVRCH